MKTRKAKAIRRCTLTTDDDEGSDYGGQIVIRLSSRGLREVILIAGFPRIWTAQGITETHLRSETARKERDSKIAQSANDSASGSLQRISAEADFRSGRSRADAEGGLSSFGRGPFLPL
jgi:hypothetical protein